MKGIIRRTASKLTRIVLFFDYERKELFLCSMGAVFVEV